MRRRRNPASIGLEQTRLYSPDPYPYPFDDPSLSDEEKKRRWEAIKAHRESDVNALGQRRHDAELHYAGIWDDRLARIQNRMASMHATGLLLPSPDPRHEARFFIEMTHVTRDVFAANLASDLVRFGPFDRWSGMKGEIMSSQRSYGYAQSKTRSFTAEQARDILEHWAKSFNALLRAHAKFGLRPEVAAARAQAVSLHGDDARRITAGVEKSYGQMTHEISEARQAIPDERWNYAHAHSNNAYDEIASILAAHGAKEPADLLERRWLTKDTTVQAAARKWIKLAERGEPVQRPARESLEEAERAGELNERGEKELARHRKLEDARAARESAARQAKQDAIDAAYDATEEHAHRYPASFEDSLGLRVTWVHPDPVNTKFVQRESVLYYPGGPRYSERVDYASETAASNGRKVRGTRADGWITPPGGDDAGTYFLTPNKVLRPKKAYPIAVERRMQLMTQRALELWHRGEMAPATPRVRDNPRRR